MEKPEILAVIKDYLQSRFQMVLATYGEHPWIATLYFAFDENLNIFFLTNPDTIHGQQIQSNSQVAITIADSPQPPASKKKGVQMFGVAEQIIDEKEINMALSLWRNTLNVTSNAYTYEGMLSNQIKGRMYKVVPKKIKYFNQELWEEGEEPLIDL